MTNYPRYIAYFVYCRVTWPGDRIDQVDVVTVETDELAKLKDGFWINGEGDYTQGSDASYWVPPSQIKMILKLRGNDDNG